MPQCPPLEVSQRLYAHMPTSIEPVNRSADIVPEATEVKAGPGQ